MKNPKKLGKWTAESKTSVAHMSDGDFFASEQSVCMPAPDTVKIEFESNGKKVVLKEGLKLEQGEVGVRMRRASMLLWPAVATGAAFAPGRQGGGCGAAVLRPADRAF